jgi:hypothetical protein
MSFVGTAVLGASVLGAGATIYGANKAASAQTNAAQIAADEAQNMFNITNTNLAPYRALGGQAQAQLSNSLASLTTPITMDESTLQNTPGYQFNLTQGEKAVANSAAARGLGSSGAALKGASTFATGLADSTYQNQFQNAVTNQTNAFNRLSSLVNTGENAAAQTGTAGATAAGQTGAAATNAGNAAAAGYNAIGTGVTNAASGAAGGLALYKGLYGNNPSSGTGNVTGASQATGAGTDAQYNNWAVQNGINPADVF